MEVERRLAKHLKRLNRTIQKLVAKSEDFGDLRKLLREERVELAIYVVPFIAGKPLSEQPRWELTQDDKRFLKQAGLRF